MKKRITALLLTALALVSMLAGCGTADAPYVPTGNGLTWDDGSGAAQETTAPEKELELVLMYYPEITMNPYSCTDYTNQTLFSLLYQGLFAVDSEYKVTPVLCGDFFVSENMRNYIFYLDENATFSDGTPMTIMDVYASYLAAKENKVYSGRFFHVRELTVTEDGGLSIFLDTAFEDLPLLLDIPIVKEAEVLADRPTGSGPYYLEQTTFGMRLRRDSDWWCRDSATLIVDSSAITLRAAESNTQIRDSFEFSDVGLVRANPGSDAYADYRCDYELWDCENNLFLYLACNMESEVFSNEALRSSLTYGIDRNALAQEHYRGFARAASLPASPAFPYYSEALAAKYAYDGEAFAKAVSKAKMRGKKVVLIVNGNSSLRCRVARQLGDMLSDGGLAVTVKELSQSSYKKALQNKEYDLVLAETKLSANMDLTPFFSTSGKLNYGEIGDLSLYGLCLQAMVNHGNYYTLHQRVMDDGRLQPILFKSYAVYTVRDLLQELTPARDNIFYYSLGKTMAQADKTK